MRMKHILIFLFFFLFLCGHVFGFDNETTHRQITEKAVNEAVSAFSLNVYLKNNIGLNQGVSSIIKDHTVTWWLREGSYLEDIPNCRAANHFHNPLKSWDQSYMNDEPWLLDVWCWDWKPFYSNITWATSYLSPPPNGSKVSFSYLSSNSPITWDRARDYYYKALTLTTKTDRDIYLTWTFQAVGHVMHLLEDVSVPAHVRNDFKSHLVFNGLKLSLPTDWVIQPFENYVKINPSLVATAAPIVFPSFTNTRLTDFWDTDQYNGSNPSTFNNIGLAEFTNANYFSNSTIPNNSPTSEHIFPNPSVNSIDYQICSDLQPPSSDFPQYYRKYVSRKNKGQCPQITPDRTVDHFAAVSLIKKE